MRHHPTYIPTGQPDFRDIVARCRPTTLARAPIALVISGLLASCAVSGVQRTEDVPLSELTGVLRVGEKRVERYSLVLDGSCERCNLRGGLLANLEEGTRVRVRGVYRSYLFEHRTVRNVAPPPFRKGWVVYMDVEDLEVVHEPFGDWRDE